MKNRFLVTNSGERSLRSQVIDLSSVKHDAVFGFRDFIDSPKNAEGDQIRFLREDGSVHSTHEQIHTGRGPHWMSEKLVIPESLQHSRFQIEFRFVSDDEEEVGLGWYIDDVTSCEASARFGTLMSRGFISQSGRRFT